MSDKFSEKEFLERYTLMERKARKERIAAAVLGGMVANPHHSFAAFKSAARTAVDYADALMAELDK